MTKLGVKTRLSAIEVTVTPYLDDGSLALPPWDGGRKYDLFVELQKLRAALAPHRIQVISDFTLELGSQIGTEIVLRYEMQGESALEAYQHVHQTFRRVYKEIFPELHPGTRVL